MASEEEPLDFVWETQLPRKWKAQHEAARVRNRLANGGILEDKAHFARLQARMPPAVPTLEVMDLRFACVIWWIR